MTVTTAGIDRILAGLPDAIDRGVERGANLIADVERQIAPYDAKATHKHLNESIEVQEGPYPLSRNVVAGVGLPDGRAYWQEFGTPYMDAQPYAAVARREIDVRAEVLIEVRKLVGG